MSQLPQIFIATHNQGKISELVVLLRGIAEVLTPADVSDKVFPDVEETGTTFEANALLKAAAIAPIAGMLTLSDDSGLEVDALNGEPGVYSKRYAPGSDDDRNRFLLKKMSGHANRKARFVSVVCLFDPNTGTHHFFEGTVAGTIAQEMRGTDGFGYDSVFIPEGYDQTLAELGSEIKNTLSHRARALAQVKEYLLK